MCNLYIVCYFLPYVFLFGSLYIAYSQLLSYIKPESISEWLIIYVILSVFYVIIRPIYNSIKYLLISENSIFFPDIEDKEEE